MIAKHDTDAVFPKDLVQSLSKMGWTSFWQTQAAEIYDGNLVPARVVGANKNSFYLSQGEDDYLASLSGKLAHRTNGPYPVVGDWVMVAGAVIHGMLSRKNALSRGASGSRGKQDALPRREQVIAANLDAVFIVCGLDRDFNLRRLERYLTLVYNCGLNPVIILTKADLHRDPEKYTREVEPAAFGVPVHTVSANDSIGLTLLEQYLAPGRTITLIGSSGSGKSTLVNSLCGRSVQATGSVSENGGKGKHTTTRRDLIMMPQGAVVIDNPGLREIAFWDCDDGIELVFPEIEDYASGCRFSDCSHLNEPGCRVIQAVADGKIIRGRLESFHKMKREQKYLSERQHKSANQVEKERWKEVALKIKDIKKGRCKT